jgi:hypothetical protein
MEVVMVRVVRIAFVLFGALLAAATALQAQTSTSATALGTVRDMSGGVVAGAQVTLRNVATNSTAVQTTNAEGYYTFLRVEPGDYVIAVKATGFESANVSDLKFDVNKSYTVDVALTVGSTATSVNVTAEAAVELQTTSATIGDVLGGQEMVNLPTLSRSAIELLTLQPGATPLAGQGDTLGENGGSVSGGRSDQNATLLDGIDVSNINATGAPNTETIVPINVDALDEFRVGVSNPNATVASASGGQISVVSKGGTNSLHGTVYWYMQNTVLNANTWENNNNFGNGGKVVPRAPVHDNRGGFALGGPIKKDKTFFFLNYEPRRFIQPQGGSGNQEINLPSADFRNGIINFTNPVTNMADVACLQSAYVISLNLTSPHSNACSGITPNSNGARISNNCGATANLSCDPRGLGMSPTSAAFVNAIKVVPNDPSHGDSLGCIGDLTCQNLSGYLYNVPAPIQEDAFNVRLDHNFSDNLHFFGRYAWFRQITSPSATPGQLDLTTGTPRLADVGATRGDAAVAAIDWTIRNNLVNTVRFGWVRQRSDSDTVNEAAVANRLQLPGSKDASGVYESFQLGNAFGNSESELIAQPIRSSPNGFYRAKNIQFSDALNWIKGSHTFLFGTDLRWQPAFLNQDINQGGVSTPRVFSDSVNASSSGPGKDSGQQRHIYETMLGLINQSSYYQGLDTSTFQPVSGHPIADYETHTHDLYFFVQDTWRIKPSLTLTYALAWGIQTPYTEDHGRAVVLVDGTPGSSTLGQPLDPVQLLATKKADALKGINYNPTYGFVPYGKLGMSGMWNTDYGDWQPRVSVAWSPSADSGLLGKLMGNSKTVIRAGYALVYDRYSGALPTRLVGQPGFNVIPSTAVGPACNLNGTQAAGCNPASNDPAASVYRAGFDGVLPVQPAMGITPPTPATPYAPDLNQGGNVIFAYDPNFKMGQNHMVDFSIQRELPGNIIMEVGYIGRLGRRLPAAYPVNADPYMFTAGGQSFAQANDCIAQTLRYGAMANWNGMPNLGGIPCQDSSGNLVDQPFFKTYLPMGWATLPAAQGGCTPDATNPNIPAVASTSNTQCIAFLQGGNFVQGNIGGPFGVFGAMAGANCGPGGQFSSKGGAQSLADFQQCSLFNNQVSDMQVRGSHDFSNYHALSVTLRNRAWRGLTYDLNYTFSKSLDQGGRTQSFINGFDDPFNPNAMYGPSYFDRTHVFNGVFNYSLPFGQGHKLSAGSGVNRIIGGWSVSGIVRVNSGLPLVNAESGFAYGGGLVTSNNVDMIPTGHNYSTGLYKNSGGTPTGTCATFAAQMGSNGSVPVIGGNSSTYGYNYFSDPVAAYCSFRPVLLSVDTRDGRGNPLRGFGLWNVDASLGKETAITERFKVKFQADFFNVFNHVSFDDPLNPFQPTGFIDATAGQAWGAITNSFTPPQRQAGSRWIQLGLRVSF